MDFGRGINVARHGLPCIRIFSEMALLAGRTARQDRVFPPML
jgi:hypothetical protein